MNEFEVKIPNSLKIKMIIMMMITVKALRVKSLWIRKFVRTNTSKLGDQYCKTFFRILNTNKFGNAGSLGPILGITIYLANVATCGAIKYLGVASFQP